MRVAWFSPMPPVATGIARCSADLVAALHRAGDQHGRPLEIDVFVDETNLDGAANGERRRSAHDFVWRHHRAPYDLIVYQLGNSSHHDYQWPYLFRYPGLVVLHDAHLHHARASCLLRTSRADDYRAEFAANHPDADPSLAELAIAGFDNHLHYLSPMTTLVLARSRMAAAHSHATVERLQTAAPSACIETIRLGHGVFLTDEDIARLGAEARARYGIPPRAIVFGCYGGLTPDKRVPQILEAFAATRASIANAHLLLAGSAADHYDLRADVARLGLEDCTTLTGYLESDDALTAAIAASDVALNLRWPTAREVSGPWLRCLAAGRATVTIELAHLSNVPSIDPRTWLSTANGAAAACTVALDVADEAHSLRLAIRRLAVDRDLRVALGRAGREYWSANHSIEHMADDYRRVIARAAAAAPPAPATPLPDHLLDSADRTLRAVLNDIGVGMPAGIDVRGVGE
jgi:glycosyltransferase involved in cell wall biosynthesis